MATSSTRDLTDVELDKNWKPSGRRPQSTMARNFSDALNDLFKIDNSIADLDAKVDQKCVRYVVKFASGDRQLTMVL
jgi:hypothetical protein